MSIAGLAIGPLVLTPLTHIFGFSSILFWSMMGSICCNVWSAVMTKQDQYVPFIISRLFVGIFSGSPTILAPQILVDIFFLHERGMVFNAFLVCSSLGVVIGPTLGGFIVQHAPWPYQFWWTIALQGVVALLCMSGIRKVSTTEAYFCPFSFSVLGRDWIYAEGWMGVSPSAFSFHPKPHCYILPRYTCSACGRFTRGSK